MRLIFLTFTLSFIFAIYAQASDSVTLKKQNNRFIRATIGYPDNYSAEFEGLTLFIIAPDGAFPWDMSDEKSAEYYAVALISPFFTITDKKMRRDRSIKEIATSTAHALSISHDMLLDGKANNFECATATCMSISLHNNSRFHYQVFLKFGPNSIYTVSAVGLPESAMEIQKIVNLMSLNISPLSTGKHSK